jgi:hypothetical protein
MTILGGNLIPHDEGPRPIPPAGAPLHADSMLLLRVAALVVRAELASYGSLQESKPLCGRELERSAVAVLAVTDMDSIRSGGDLDAVSAVAAERARLEVVLGVHGVSPSRAVVIAFRVAS